MIPLALSSLLNRVSNLKGNDVLLKDNVDKKSMVYPDRGLNTNSLIRFNAKHVILAMTNTIKLGNMKTDAQKLCLAIESGTIHNDGTFRGSGQRVPPSKFNTIIRQTHSQQQDTLSDNDSSKAPPLDILALSPKARKVVCPKVTHLCFQIPVLIWRHS